MKDKNKVYVVQEIPGTREGRPKFNIMGALKYGKLKVLLKENAQIVLGIGILLDCNNDEVRYLLPHMFIVLPLLMTKAP